MQIIAPQDGAIDAFILFNEHEEMIPRLVSLLESAGLTTYMWRRDIPLGAEWQQVEIGRLISAKVVLVCLGPIGWGPTHERLVEEALRLGKLIIPVLVGQVPEGEFAKGQGIFERLRYSKLNSLSDQPAIDRLVDQIRSAPTPPDRQFDAIISSLTNGTDDVRLRSLERIRSLSAHERIRLAFRLRTELTDRFNPQKVTDFASSVRDPILIPGIRSWLFSALINSDVESEATKTLIREELPSANSTARFWLLTGLYRVRASYLPDVAMELANGSTDDESTLLARIIANSPSDELILNLRGELASGEFAIAWRVLRVMRTVPIPTLVPDVCRLFLESEIKSPLTYDALYALCSTAERAAELLTAEPGVEATLTRMIETMRLFNDVAVMNFTVLVAAFNPHEVERAFSAIEQNTTNTSTVGTLRAQLREYRQRTGIGLRTLAGFISDEINTNNDFLGFDRDVQTLTSVIMAKAVTPPLAIGLFGDWGTGKSHFYAIDARRGLRITRPRDWQRLERFLPKDRPDSIQRLALC